MSDYIALPQPAVTWLHKLAGTRAAGDGWDTAPPCQMWEELLALGVIEHRPAAFRLSDIGWWTMNRLVAKGENGP